MKKRAKLFFALMIMGSFLLTSCASTILTAVWKDDSFTGPVGKMAVIGIFKTPAIKNFFEDEFSRQLTAHSTEAVAGYTLIPVGDRSDREIVASKLRNGGIDYVLVTRLVDKKTVQTYVPGQAYVVPGYYRSWGGYYQYAYTPGYIVEDVYAFAETNMYDLKQDRLIWSARSETEISGMNQELIRSFVKTMIDKLSADALIR